MKFLKISVTILVILVLSEIALAISGSHFGIRTDISSEYNPELIAEISDSGPQTILSEPGCPFKGVIWPDGMRASRPLALAPKPYRVLLVGSSITWGLGVNDQDTFAWWLNENCSQAQFDNASVPGYGPSRCRDAIVKRLANKQYDLVLYCTCSNQMARDLYPYAYLKGDCPASDKNPPLYGSSANNSLRDMLYYYPYSTLAYGSIDDPLVKKFGITLQDHPGSAIVWPGDSQLRLINFTKIHVHWLINRMYTFCMTSLNRAPNDMLYLRMHLLMEQMRQEAEKIGAKFGVVNVDDRVGYARWREWCSWYFTADELPPILDVSYPESIMNNEDWHTKPFAHDSGDHPSGILHTRMGQHIKRWLDAGECDSAFPK